MKLYEMSLENGKEYIRIGINRIEKFDAGKWIIAFLDVDWKKLSEKCSLIRSDYDNPSPLSIIFGNFFDSLYSTLRPIHPFLREFIDEQFYYQMHNQLHSGESYSYTEEDEYLDALIHHASRKVVRDGFPLECLRWLNEQFSIFARLKDYLEPLLDEIMCSNDKDTECSILGKYHKLRIENRSYGIALYNAMGQIILEPVIYSGKYICDFMPSNKEADDNELKEEDYIYQTYYAADNIWSLTLWEFDQLCGRNIPLRKCKNCGKYFVPHSVVSCYCDRPVLGMQNKTCKNIGASIEYQRKINADVAQKLYKRANNRIHTYASRKKETQPELLQVYYKRWQYDAKIMLEKVKNEELDFIIFKEEMERSGPNVMKLYKAKAKNSI